MPCGGPAGDTTQIEADCRREVGRCLAATWREERRLTRVIPVNFSAWPILDPQVPVEPPPTQAIAVLTGIPGRPYCLLDALVRAAELVLGDWRRRLAAQIARKLPKLTIRAGIKRPGEKQARWMFWAPAICRISPRAGRARRGEMVI